MKNQRDKHKTTEHHEEIDEPNAKKAKYTPKEAQSQTAAIVDIKTPIPKQKVSKQPVSAIISNGLNSQTKAEDIRLTCEAAVIFTKKLLGYGAYNIKNEIDHSGGLAYHAGLVAKGWHYISAKDRSKTSATNSSSSSSQSNALFYHSPSAEPNDPIKYNDIARASTGAVLAHGGGCDEHAYVLATLLRQLLPAGTTINICAFKSINDNGGEISHTFVVIGEVFNDKLERNHAHNNNLLVVDAWPIQGGTIILKDYFLQRNQDIYLGVDTQMRADGKDHLIKRVNKQLQFLSDDKIAPVKSKLPSHSIHKVENQKEITKFIMPIPEEDHIDEIWSAPTISKKYQAPAKLKEKIIELNKKYPELKKLIDQIQAELNAAGVNPRLNTDSKSNPSL